MNLKKPRPGEETSFEDFKSLARDPSLTPYEKIGFPNSYRAGKEDLIFQDILRKLSNLGQESRTVVDIGPGCSGPAFMLIDLCRAQGHQLVLIDSEEMLSHLPNEPFLQKVAGKYPDECGEFLNDRQGKIDVVLSYSVLHYIFAETNLFSFLDKSLALLAEGGQMLLGDIPNISKRKRFFSSPAGIQFHQAFTGTKEIPKVKFKSIEEGKIDDSVLLSLLLRARQAGFDAYLVPQPEDLPMANRREDLLITKP